MKHLIFSSIGMIMLLIFGARMFGIFETYIKTDKQFLFFLFGGILFSILGFYFEQKKIVPISRFQLENKKTSMRSCSYAVGCCLILIILLMSSCSPQSGHKVDGQKKFRLRGITTRHYMIKSLDSLYRVGDTIHDGENYYQIVN